MPRKRKSRLTLCKKYLKEKEKKNSQPLPANWTEDLLIFDADCDDNGDYFNFNFIGLFAMHKQWAHY